MIAVAEWVFWASGGLIVVVVGLWSYVEYKRAMRGKK